MQIPSGSHTTRYKVACQISSTVFGNVQPDAFLVCGTGQCAARNLLDYAFQNLKR
jgi:hypothetical protein